jgi:hypothetical protein
MATDKESFIANCGLYCEECHADTGIQRLKNKNLIF